MTTDAFCPLALHRALAWLARDRFSELSRFERRLLRRLRRRLARTSPADIERVFSEGFWAATRLPGTAELVYGLRCVENWAIRASA